MRAVDLMRANDLWLAYCELNSFLKKGYNDPGSLELRPPTEDDLTKIAEGKVIRIALTDDEDYTTRDDNGCDELFSCRLPREYVERALRFEMQRMRVELMFMNIEIPASPDTATGRTP